MKTSMIRTSVVGNQPLDRLPPYRRGWRAELDDGVSLRIRDPDQRWEMTAEHIRTCVRVQEGLGLDILTEGELARSDYWSPFVLDMDGTELRADGSVHVVGPLRCRPEYTVREWQLAQAATSRPVKVTIPGPMTCATYIRTDAMHGSFREACRAWAAIINETAHSLVAAGCRYIQLDDCQLTYQLEKAIDFGFEDVGVALRDLGPDITTLLHICRGTPGFIDSYEGHGKAPRADCYQFLLPHADQIPADVLSVEQAFHSTNPDVFRSITTQTIMLGVININTPEVESVEGIIDRARPFLEFVEPARLILAPDCGFSSWASHLPNSPLYSAALKKLENMVEAARILNGA